MGCKCLIAMMIYLFHAMTLGYASLLQEEPLRPIENYSHQKPLYDQTITPPSTKRESTVYEGDDSMPSAYNQVEAVNTFLQQILNWIHSDPENPDILQNPQQICQYLQERQAEYTALAQQLKEGNTLMASIMLELESVRRLSDEEAWEVVDEDPHAPAHALTPFETFVRHFKESSHILSDLLSTALNEGKLDL